ncbi:chlorite dismutase family protein [Leucobacter sp. CSA1]|uniref:Coproheme decarboxylase n=1 Tax=Leucobacter chromiisoli TaxID=2796471 RepID=A0A934Q8L6_9MICO|nr:hydrogen peroxide-dependent heme synthase [Leucobacter chromiisoli]MBK0419473.1 chlorite dismutase family protein [Leucobacter chromiisoli]
MSTVEITSANSAAAHAETAEEISVNESEAVNGSPQHFTLFAVFRVSSSHPIVLDGRDVPGVVREFEDVIGLIGNENVTLRGCYDISGMRADADLMLWLHGSAAEDLQWALRELRRTALLRPLIRVWGAVGVHREAEFNRAHQPGFVRGVPAKQWLAVYPFVRSNDWYLLDPAERSRMLADHGRTGAAFSGVVANTVAAFALGDYEWLLPMEADDLTELVDMMRALRGVDARRHVREETPFYTGRRIEPAEIIEVLQ